MKIRFKQVVLVSFFFLLGYSLALRWGNEPIDFILFFPENVLHKKKPQVYEEKEIDINTRLLWPVDCPVCGFMVLPSSTGYSDEHRFYCKKCEMTILLFTHENECDPEVEEELKKQKANEIPD